MIVDDSTVARAVLSRMIEADPAFEICAVAGTAEDAIEALGQVRVDIVLLDLEMPGAGGLKSIPRIIGAAAGAKVMIVSSLAEEGAEHTVAALALGAADTLPKPGTGRFNGRFSEVLLGKLKALGHATAPLPEPAPSRCPGSATDFVPCRPIRLIFWRSALRPAGSTRSACSSRRFRSGSVSRSSLRSICRGRSCQSLRVSSGRLRIGNAWSPKTAWRSFRTAFSSLRAMPT